jgi:hypothetical protein
VAKPKDDVAISDFKIIIIKSFGLIHYVDWIPNQVWNDDDVITKKIPSNCFGEDFVIKN